MHLPTVAFKHAGAADVSETIHCARVDDRHNHELLRYLVLAIAFVAVILLISIALYYTQGNSLHLQHGILVAPQNKLPS